MRTCLKPAIGNLHIWFALGVTAVTFAAGIAILSILGATAISVLLVCAIGLGAFTLLLLELYMRQNTILQTIQREQWQHYQQTESFITLTNTLQFNNVIPSTRKWAMSPDGLLCIIKEMQKQSPKTIVECGSGISTLVMAKYLQKIKGEAHIWALEHEEAYAKETRQLLKRHGVQDYVTVLNAPLQEDTVNNKKTHRYSLEEIGELKNVDILLIDGPPSNDKNPARMATYNSLKEKLHNHATVIFDDANRSDVKNILRSMQKQTDKHIIEKPDLEKGIAVVYVNKT